uniref:hypothetical protein n=1 Tax=Variovorax sp. HW80 TaxID=1816232 RepID=UPI00159F04E7|nr:hypothetical protein [Variovorax sp. HW80]
MTITYAQCEELMWREFEKPSPAALPTAASGPSQAPSAAVDNAAFGRGMTVAARQRLSDASKYWYANHQLHRLITLPSHPSVEQQARRWAQLVIGYGTASQR